MASTLSRFRTRRPTLSAEGGCGAQARISQQVSKNLFLWQGRSFVRKGLEAYFTVLIELLWSKGRILAGISVLPAQDGPLIHPKAAAPTRNLLHRTSSRL